MWNESSTPMYPCTCLHDSETRSSMHKDPFSFHVSLMLMMFTVTGPITNVTRHSKWQWCPIQSNNDNNLKTRTITILAKPSQIIHPTQPINRIPFLCLWAEISQVDPTSYTNDMAGNLCLTQNNSKRYVLSRYQIPILQWASWQQWKHQPIWAGLRHLTLYFPIYPVTLLHCRFLAWHPYLCN